MTWLITGGAGYIGGHLVETMLDSGYEVVVFDNFSSGIRERVPKAVPVVAGDIRDEEIISNTLVTFKVTGIINLAALKSVGESHLIPEEYEAVNHLGVRSLLRCAVKGGITTFIQSSTAAVYGHTQNGVATEESALTPISPYGVTKLAAEEEVSRFISSGHGQAVSLRYFNVVGSRSKRLKDLGLTNLFPLILKNISENVSPTIFGDDYPTFDGTCVRDYVHVEDIARAHVLTVKALESRQVSRQLNIGTGLGYSVKEVISELLLANKSNLVPNVAARREGDPAILIADAQLAEAEIGFRALKNLREMVETTYG